MEEELVIVIFQGLGRKKLPADFLLQTAKACISGKMGGEMQVDFIVNSKEFIQRWQVGIIMQEVIRCGEVTITLSEKGGISSAKRNVFVEHIAQPEQRSSLVVLAF
jgi:hypothetical protein